MNLLRNTMNEACKNKSCKYVSSAMLNMNKDWNSSGEYSENPDKSSEKQARTFEHLDMPFVNCIQGLQVKNAKPDGKWRELLKGAYGHMGIYHCVSRLRAKKILTVH